MKGFFSIKWQLLLACLGFVIVPTVVMGVIIYNSYRFQVLEKTERDLGLVVQGWRTAADIYHEEMQRILKREEYLVEKRLSSIALDAKSMLEIYNGCKRSEGFSRGSKEDRAHRELLFDKIAAIKVGRSGYVFMIDDQDRYLVSKGRLFDGMNVLDEKQTFPRESYAAILKEARTLKGNDVKTFHYEWVETGYTEPRMKMAVMAYMPEEGLVVGASAYYTDFKSYDLRRILQEEFKDRLAGQKIGYRGYSWVLNSRGDYVVSRGRLQDGENVMGDRDEGGRPFIRDIIESVGSVPSSGTLAARYTVKNLMDRKPERKISVYVYYPGWDWIIGATDYEDDLLKGLAAIRWNIILICFGFILVAGAVAYFMAMHISWPIRKLERIAAAGDLNAKIEPRMLSSNDEIGRLSVSFLSMMRVLRDKIAELEGSRAELTRKNEELKQAYRQLVQSEKLAAIGQLAAGVAHEINNPLAYVMSNIQTLEVYIARYEEVLNELLTLDQRQEVWRTLEEARDDVALASRGMHAGSFGEVRKDIKAMIPELFDGLNRVKNIVADLQTFARAEKELPSEVNIEAILDQVITILGIQIRERVELVREYCGLPVFTGYPQRLSQVFMNILLNAFQSIEHSRGLITVRTYRDKGHVFVDIADNGAGIPQKDVPRVFEPFFTTKPVGQGTGLGLSISYEIIKKHGGELSFRSEFGQGTTFTVKLPLR